MEPRVIIAIICGLMVVVCAGVLLYLYFGGRSQSSLQTLLKVSRRKSLTPAEARERMKQDITGKEYERIKHLQRKQVRRSIQQEISKEERYFHAGLITKADVQRFERGKYMLAAILVPFFAVAGSSIAEVPGLLIGVAAGGIGSIILPSFTLDRKKKRRGEEYMYYLPLVIEQVSIGVSSSLDIGPCLQRVVAMADERDSHNPVTELIRMSQYHVKSGVSLGEALTEVGTRSGHTELKHAFMALASVAKHGGEISRQLQELADAVEGQRETAIEAKIKKLELEATGPVALVFMGFLVLILTGFGLQLSKVFSM